MNPRSRAAGLTAEAEHLYRHTLRALPASVSDHADALGWSVRQTQRVLRDLERLRLARQAPDGTVRVDDPLSLIHI